MDDLAVADDDLIDPVDWGHISNESSLFPVVADGPFSDPSPDYMLEIQNLLMDDNDNPVSESPSDFSAKEFCDKFLADIPVGQVQQDPKPSGEPAVDSPLDPDKNSVPAAEDPVFKKRTRKMRNREAAVRSRERKKLYVKNLEMKSRYLEGECRKLGYLLQCCCAENHALRLYLQSNTAFGASVSKLESAVLVLESLLLGSLLWFMGIICQHNLLLVPYLIPELEVMPPANMEHQGLRRVAIQGARNKIWAYFVVLQSFANSRRSRASRTKMKTNFLVF
ncbi:bZIP transcription factor 50 [Neltuma alba]|uniref:bZIP transcription factor 50 n=1 Tax=Neltuma alba TaxID=207710 RepID=UPI0010A351C8|nr:bZIP transcription factor 50 [Prosopis alba]XP_028765810.1 bZIP transcription factor 50 [Prosopis alba]